MLCSSLQFFFFSPFGGVGDHMLYHMAYQIIPYILSIFMDSECQRCISFPHIDVSNKIIMKEARGGGIYDVIEILEEN